MWLNLAELAADVVTLGPGRRIAVWVQGCHFHCPGCTSPFWQPFRANRLTQVSELATALLAHHDHHGLTFSGGEPMLQARGLLGLWQTVRAARPAWNLIVFSGFTRCQLLAEGQFDRVALLQAADAFIGGPFVQSKLSDRGLRGSTNQETFFRPDSRFTLSQQNEIVTGARRVEARIGLNNILLIGIPSPPAQDQERGIDPSW